MDKQAIFEIGNLIHTRYKGWFRRKELTPEEIIENPEYLEFKKSCPRLCELVENYPGDQTE